MNASQIYESMYRNTRAMTEAIADGLRRRRVWAALSHGAGLRPAGTRPSLVVVAGTADRAHHRETRVARPASKSRQSA